MGSRINFSGTGSGAGMRSDGHGKSSKVAGVSVKTTDARMTGVEWSDCD